VGTDAAGVADVLGAALVGIESPRRRHNANENRFNSFVFADSLTGDTTGSSNDDSIMAGEEAFTRFRPSD
jgi:hypothetical protein